MRGATAAAAALALALGPAAGGAQSLGEIITARALMHTPAGAVASVLTPTLLQPGFRRFGVHAHYAVVHDPLRFGNRTLSSYGGFVDLSQAMGASLDVRTRRFAGAATVGRGTSRCRSTCERTTLVGASAHALLLTTRLGSARRAPRFGVGAEGSFGIGRVNADARDVDASALTAAVPLSLDFTVDNPSWSRDRVRRYDTRTYLFLAPGVASIRDDIDPGGAGGTLSLVNGGIGVGVDAPAFSVSLTLALRRVLIRNSEFLLGIGTGVRW